VDTYREVFFDRGDGRLHVPISVVDTVGCNKYVGCEPVTSYMRTFSHQLRPPLTQRTSHGPSPHGTALVMLTVGADQDDGRIAERSGETEGSGNLRKILILAPRSPLLAIGARILMVQYCPMALTLTAAGAGPVSRAAPAPALPSRRRARVLWSQAQDQAFESVERPPAPVLDEDPHDAVRRWACSRVAAQPGAF
jgi:hypothetical protein